MDENESLTKRERKKLNKEASKESSPSSPLKGKLGPIVAVVVIALAAFWFMYRGNDSTPESTNVATSPSEVTSSDHAKGAENALVTLVEYGDFQCPACGAYHPIIKQVAEEFQNDLKVVYRHFPLRNIHRHAQIAAQAAEAAADQGMFWEMVDMLYTRQDDWVNVRDPRGLFKEYADELTLNAEQFDKYMNSEEAKNKVNADYTSGVSAAIDSTPTFFINGEKIENPQGLEPFRALILQKLEEVMPAGRGEDATDSGEATPEGEITPQL